MILFLKMYNTCPQTTPQSKVSIMADPLGRITGLLLVNQCVSPSLEIYIELEQLGI